MQRSFVHGMVGGGLACISGGNFSDGFAAGFSGELAFRGNTTHISTGNTVMPSSIWPAPQFLLSLEELPQLSWAGNFENGAYLTAFEYLGNNFT